MAGFVVTPRWLTGSDVIHGGDMDPTTLKTAGTALDPFSLLFQNLYFDPPVQDDDFRVLLPRACVDNRLLVNGHASRLVALEGEDLHLSYQGCRRGRSGHDNGAKRTGRYQRGGKGEAEDQGDEDTDLTHSLGA